MIPEEARALRYSILGVIGGVVSVLSIYWCIFWHLRLHESQGRGRRAINESHNRGERRTLFTAAKGGHQQSPLFVCGGHLLVFVVGTANYGGSAAFFMPSLGWVRAIA